MKKGKPEQKPPKIVPYDGLAEIYRPKKLNDVMGQDNIVVQLRGMFRKGRIARNIMLFGPTGSGKTTLGYIITRYVNCQNLQDGELCGKCASCKYDIDDHPDLHEMDCADARGIDDARNIKQISTFAPEFNYQVFLLDEAHQLTDAAKQSLLKTLEKPPSQTIFIQCTTEPEKLLVTVRGRSIKLPIKPVSVSTCTKLLKRVAKKEGVPIPKDVLKRIARLVNGQPRDALKTLDGVINYINGKGDDPKRVVNDLKGIVAQVLDLPDEAHVIKFLASMYLNKYAGAFKTIENIPFKDGITFLSQVIDYHKMAMYYSVHKDLRDDDYDALYGVMNQYKVRIDNARMAAALAIMIRTLSEMKMYMMSDKLLLLDMAARVVEVLHSNPKHKK